MTNCVSDHHTRVDVQVGPKLMSYPTHLCLLTHYSEYFKAACSVGNGFTESLGVVNLSEESTEIYELFAQWLVSGTAGYHDDTREPVDLDDLLKLWIFADARGIPALANWVIDNIVLKHAEFGRLPLRDIKYVYQNTLESSPLRSILVDLMAFSIPARTMFHHQIGLLDQEALSDITLALQSSPGMEWKAKKMLEMRLCRYHLHNGGEECERRRLVKPAVDRNSAWFCYREYGSETENDE